MKKPWPGCSRSGGVRDPLMLVVQAALEVMRSVVEAVTVRKFSQPAAEKSTPIERPNLTMKC